MKRLILSLLLVPFISIAQQKKEVLFIGNSYTFANNLPSLVEQIALSLGDTLIHDSSTPGGATFNLHTTNSQTITKINQQVWDYIILQGQSQEPALSPNYVNTNVFPAVQSLINIIAQSSTCIEPMFFMTWGRKNGDAMNCAAYPPVCTYLGMQERLRTRYLQFAFMHNASCAPVGMSWKASIATNPNLDLYSADESHPSIYGSYLSACTFYASIFKKSPISSTFIPNGVDTATASFLQNIASATVLDSLPVWNIYNTDFTVVQNNDSITLTNLSSNFDSVLWDFGDGNTSNLINPNHTYTTSGTFAITLTTYTNATCQTDTASVTINVNITTGINEIPAEKILIKITDLQGRRCMPLKNSPCLYFFSDGTVEKKVVLE